MEALARWKSSQAFYLHFVIHPLFWKFIHKYDAIGHKLKTFVYSDYPHYQKCLNSFPLGGSVSRKCCQVIYRDYYGSCIFMSWNLRTLHGQKYLRVSVWRPQRETLAIQRFKRDVRPSFFVPFWREWILSQEQHRLVRRGKKSSIGPFCAGICCDFDDNCCIWSMCGSRWCVYEMSPIKSFSDGTRFCTVFVHIRSARDTWNKRDIKAICEKTTGWWRFTLTASSGR